MNKILLVLSNLKHDGTLLEAGNLLEADPAQFADQIAGGALRVVEGADTLEDAAKIVKEQVATGAAKAKAAEAAQPKDTWAPSPEKPADTTAAPEKAAEDAGTTAKPPEVGAGDLPPAEPTVPAPTETGDNL